ncbi:MAG: response regulator [Deltaproteobacteria bacterium]|nr:response regulator [Deltaproteobacteria bacterium]
MIQILIASTDKDSLSELKAGLEEDDVQITWVESCENVLTKVKSEKFDLIITGEELSDKKGLECIRMLVSQNPMLNCAAVSSLSHDDFHEASEGLGILMQLPVRPAIEDAEKLLEHLKTIINLTKRTP